MLHKIFKFDDNVVLCDFGGKHLHIQQYVPVQEITEVTCKHGEKTHNSSLFLLNTPAFLQYYVWFDKDQLGKDLELPGKTGIRVQISKTTPATEVATIMAAAIDEVDGLSAISDGIKVVVTCDDAGLVYPAEDISSGYKIEVTTKGDLTQTLFSGQLWPDVHDLKDVVLYEDGSADFYFTMTKTYFCKINRSPRYDVNKQFFQDDFRSIPTGWLTYLNPVTP